MAETMTPEGRLIVSLEAENLAAKYYERFSRLWSLLADNIQREMNAAYSRGVSDSAKVIKSIQWNRPKDQVVAAILRLIPNQEGEEA